MHKAAMSPVIKQRASKRAWAADDSRFKRVAAKREVMLDAALLVFLKEGFAGSSMERVASQAGVSKMTLYRHFKDKEALFLATINRHCDQIYDVEEHPPAASPDTARAELVRFGRTFVDTIIAPDVLGLFQMLFGEAPRFPEVAQHFYDAGPARTILVIERILSGIMPAPAAKGRAAAFMHLLMGDTYQRLALRKIDRKHADADFDRQILLAAELVVG
jgi:TetR/AcrR family transcriptional repressor of mexJK operon